MAFNMLKALGLQVGNANRFTAPLSALADIQDGITNLKGSAASVANRCDPVGAAPSIANVIDITGCARIACYPMIANLASLSVSTDPRVMIFCGRGDLSIVGGAVTVSGVTMLERMHNVDDALTLDDGTQGAACGFAASPSSSNTLVAGGFLTPGPIQFLNKNGIYSPYLDTRGFNFCIPLLVLAGAGTLVTGETSKLAILGTN